MNNNLTDYRDPNCLKYDHVVQSDYEEIFWVGIATIGLNAVYFGVKALYIITKLLNVIWVYRPYRFLTPGPGLVADRNKNSMFALI